MEIELYFQVVTYKRDEETENHEEKIVYLLYKK